MKILTNKIQCNKCKEIVESLFGHDLKMCRCNTVGVSGGRDHLKRTGLSKEMTELSQFLSNNGKVIGALKSK